VNGDGLRLTGIQVDSAKSRQGAHSEVSPWWPSAGRAQVHLRHLITGDPAGVFQLEGNVETAIAGGRIL
jgi:hypothetical protein